MSNKNGEQPKYDGVAIKLAGREYIVPSLTVKQARKLWPEVLEMEAGITKENLPDKQAKMLAVIHTALARNYPSVTIEEMEDLVDLSSINKLVTIVMGNSGIPSVPPERPVTEKALAVQ